MQNEQQQISGDVISLKDIVYFLKCNFMPIIFCGIVGLLVSSAYVFLTPKKYLASFQMQVAQVASNSNTSSNTVSNTVSNTLSNIEEPAALIERLRSPAAYNIEAQQKCGLPEGGEFGEYLDNKLEVQRMNNVTNAVQLKTIADTPAQAKQCAEAIVTMIIAQHRSLIEERFAGRHAQLVQYQHALDEELRQLEKIKNSELGNFGYLAKMDKLSWLHTRIDALQEEALLSQMHPAKLIGSVYTPSKPIPHKVVRVLLFGILLGMTLGALYAMGARRLAKDGMSDL